MEVVDDLAASCAAAALLAATEACREQRLQSIAACRHADSSIEGKLGRSTRPSCQRCLERRLEVIRRGEQASRTTLEVSADDSASPSGPCDRVEHAFVGAGEDDRLVTERPGRPVCQQLADDFVRDGKADKPRPGKVAATLDEFLVPVPDNPADRR